MVRLLVSIIINLQGISVRYLLVDLSLNIDQQSSEGKFMVSGNCHLRTASLFKLNNTNTALK